MRRVVWSLLWCLWLLLLSSHPGWSRSFPHPADAERAAHQRWGAAKGGSVLSGCHATLSPPLTLTLSACRGMAFDATDPATLAGFEEPTARTLTLPATTGTVWLAGRRQPAQDPPGWTCQPGQHYCWVTSASAPALPPGLTWLFEVPVASGAITAVKDITTRTLVQALPLTQPLELGRLAQWTIDPGGTIDLAAGVTLTVGGCLEAGLQQVFTGANALRGVRWAAQARCSTIRPEWWGAQGDGTTGGQEVFFQAASDALPAGGVVRTAGPTAHYKFGATWTISSSHFTFEGEGALFSSGTLVRFLVSPPLTRANAGDWSLALHNVHLRHWRVGTDNTSANQMLAAQLRWCEACSVEHVTKRGETTTAFNLYNCRHCRLAHLDIQGNNGSGFHILAHFAFESVLEDIYVTQGEDAARGPARVLQMKGGQNNRIQHVSVVDIADPLAEIAFYNRGDDPDNASASSPDVQVYPWPTNGALDCRVDDCYALPDNRRANHSNLYSSLTVQDAPHMIAFNDQESLGTMWTNLVADNVRAGMVMLRTNDATAVEKNFTLQTFRFTSLGITAGLGTAGIGVQVRGADLLEPPLNLEGVRIADGLIANATAEAVSVLYTTDLVVTELRVTNVGLGLPAGSAAAIRIGQDAQRPLVSNNYIEDLATTLSHGIYITPNAYRPVVQGNRVVCPSCDRTTFFFLHSWVAGLYGPNEPALCTARTTDAVATDTRCRVRIDPGAVVSVVATCTAKAGGQRGYYVRHYLVRDAAGTAATETAPGQDVTIESVSGWEVDYVNAVGFWYLRLLGAAGTTVDWLCDLRTMLHD